MVKTFLISIFKYTHEAQNTLFSTLMLYNLQRTNSKWWWPGQEKLNNTHK